MKKSIKTIGRTIGRKIRDAGIKTVVVLEDTKGELATSTIGGIIAGVVIIGLLMVAVNAFFPSFFADMFNSMKTKLNSNW